MENTPASALYGVVGYPAGHSLSPAMHNAAFRAFSMDAEYRVFEVAPHDLETFIQSLPSRGILGLNVTIPHKEKAAALLDYVSPEARRVGAVNTVKVHSGRREGFNTDGPGFLAHLRELGVELGAKTIAVLGAGGASRAICFYCAQSAPKEIAVYNRDSAKSHRLVEALNENFPGTTAFRAAETVEKLDLAEADILINATSLGMKEDDEMPVEPRYLHPGLFVYDLVYNPARTKLIELSLKKGCRASNGLGMLLHQGMLSFEIWTGRKPPRKEMETALLEAQEELWRSSKKHT